MILLVITNHTTTKHNTNISGCNNNTRYTCLPISIPVCKHTYTYLYTYIYIYRERERYLCVYM